MDAAADPTIDAALDAHLDPSLDAAGDVGVDAGLDASLDGGDAPASDAGLDAHIDCGSRILWIAGPENDTTFSLAAAPDGALYLAGTISADELIPGRPRGFGVMRLDGGRASWFQPTPAIDLAVDGDELWAAGRVGVTRLDRGTGAVRAEVGSFMGTVGSISVATDGAGTALLAITCNTNLFWNGAAIGCARDDAMVLAVDPAGTVVSTSVGRGSQADILSDVAWTGADFVVSGNTDLAPVCFGTACGPNPFVLRVGGTPPAPSAIVAGLPGVFYRLAVAPDRSVFGTGNTFDAADADGAGRWSLPSPAFAQVAVDPARSRVYVAGRISFPLVFADRTIMPLGAGETLLVLGVDRASGAIVEEHAFGGDADIQDVTGLAVDGAGRITVTGNTLTPFPACPGGPAPPPSAQTETFILTIEP